MVAESVDRRTCSQPGLSPRSPMRRPLRLARNKSRLFCVQVVNARGRCVSYSVGEGGGVGIGWVIVIELI